MIIREELAAFVAHQPRVIYVVIAHHRLILEEICYWLRYGIFAYVERRVVFAISQNLRSEMSLAKVGLGLEAPRFRTSLQSTPGVSLLKLGQCFSGLHDLLLVKRRIQIIKSLFNDYCVSLASRNAIFLLNVIDLRL